MAVSVTIQSAVLNPDSSLTIRYDYDEGQGAFTNNRVVLFPEQYTDEALSRQASFGNNLGVLHIFIAWWKARSSDFSNTNLVTGKTMTADLSNANPLRVQ